MKPIKALVAGHDWGGLNLLAPLLRAWREDNRITAEFIGAPSARRNMATRVPDLVLAQRANEITDFVCNRRNELDRLFAKVLEQGCYDVVVCSTSAHSLIERRLLCGARVAGVRSIAFCDMWCAYTERFYDGETWILPDRLWVIDDAMRVDAARIRWPSPLPIDVVGSPLFGDLIRRRENSGMWSGRSIRYISEHVSAEYPNSGIDEFVIAEVVVKAARKAGLDVPVIIRPHPAESQEPWRRWTYDRRKQGVVLETLPFEEAIADTQFAVGINSMLLSEMRMSGIAAASVQPVGADRSYYCLPFTALGIAEVSNADDLARWFAAPAKAVAPEVLDAHLRAVDTATCSVLHIVAAQQPGVVR